MARRTLILIVILALFGGYSHELKAKRSYTPEMPDLGQIPETLDGWYSEDFTISEGEADVLAADLTLHRRYWNTAGNEIWLFIAYFAEQTVNSQIHSPRLCVPGGGWDIVSIDPIDVSVAEESWDATRMVLSREDRSQEMLYWFLEHVDPKPTNFAFSEAEQEELGGISTDFSSYEDVMDLLVTVHEADPDKSHYPRNSRAVDRLFDRIWKMAAPMPHNR